MGLPSELGLQDVEALPRFQRLPEALRTSVTSAGLGAGHLVFRLAEAFPPRLLPHSPGLTVSTLSGDLYPRDYPMLKTDAQHLSGSQFIPALTDGVFLREFR